jgi:hypothetical protein
VMPRGIKFRVELPEIRKHAAMCWRITARNSACPILVL